MAETNEGHKGPQPNSATPLTHRPAEKKNFKATRRAESTPGAPEAIRPKITKLEKGSQSRGHGKGSKTRPFDSSSKITYEMIYSGIPIVQSRPAHAKPTSRGHRPPRRPRRHTDSREKKPSKQPDVQNRPPALPERPGQKWQSQRGVKERPRGHGAKNATNGLLVENHPRIMPNKYNPRNTKTKIGYRSKLRPVGPQAATPKLPVNPPQQRHTGDPPAPGGSSPV